MTDPDTTDTTDITDIQHTTDPVESPRSQPCQALQALPTGTMEMPPPAAQEPESEYEPGKVLTFRMPLFHPGAKVRLKGQGREEVVSHIMVRKQLLSVHLVGREIAVRPEDLEIKPTVFSTQRRPEPLLI